MSPFPLRLLRGSSSQNTGSVRETPAQLKVKLLEESVKSEKLKQERFKVELENERRKSQLIEEELNQAKIKTKSDFIDLWAKKRRLEQELGEECPVHMGLD